MTQILSTLPQYDAAVQGEQRDSRPVAASVADHPKVSNSKTARCFRPVEMPADHYATVASRIDVWVEW